SIIARRPNPTKGPQESTVHLEIEEHDLDGVHIRMFDCAGQVAYYGLLQLFLTAQALFLLVWDVSKLNPSVEEDQVQRDIRRLEELGVRPWLRSLSFRLPGADVILVGTKCD
ncbi:unnamed protein product, partial [Discosporangium mesarthrocarpum]